MRGKDWNVHGLSIPSMAPRSKFQLMWKILQMTNSGRQVVLRFIRAAFPRTKHCLGSKLRCVSPPSSLLHFYIQDLQQCSNHRAFSIELSRPIGLLWSFFNPFNDCQVVNIHGIPTSLLYSLNGPGCVLEAEKLVHCHLNISSFVK